MRLFLPLPCYPGHPAERVDRSHADVDLHVPAVVELDEGHAVDVGAEDVEAGGTGQH